ncbi:MAG: T9SS type A sorting domain-containing protein [Bacteroidia bacterium]|jgi:photosystem II stability/assembly factor-like uncharacterized protein
MKKTLIIVALLFSFVMKAQWQMISVDSQQIWNLFVTDSIIYGTSYYGVYTSTDAGNSWSLTNNGLQGAAFITSITKSNANLFVGTSDGNVYTSINNGGLWTNTSNGLPSHRIRFLYANDTTLFAGVDSSGIFVSTNNGLLWTPSNNGLTTAQVYYSILINGTTIFLGTDAGAFKSTNNGGLWVSANSGLNGNSAFSLAISDSTIFVLTDSGMYTSSNNGSFWTVTNNNGITEFPIVSLAANATNVFAGTFSGLGNGVVYSSSDLGNSWFSTNLNYYYFDALSLALTSTDIYAIIENNDFGMPTSSVWKRSLSEITGIAQKINNSDLTIYPTIYPNPATSIVTIEFQTTTSKNLIEIKNLLGETVYSDFLKTATGNNFMTIDIATFSNGVYFVQIQNEQKVLSKKFIKQ